jgi:hypothetical protein
MGRHRDGLLRDESQLRAVFEVQHPGSALAHQGPHRVGACGDVDCRLASDLTPATVTTGNGASVPVNVVRNMISVTESAASQIHKLIEKQHAEATGFASMWA